MALLASIIFTPFVFENDNFFAAFLIHDLGFNLGVGKIGGADGDIRALASKQHVGQRDGISNLACKLLHINGITKANAILPAPSYYNCVHEWSFNREKGWSGWYDKLREPPEWPNVLDSPRR